MRALYVSGAIATLALIAMALFWLAAPLGAAPAKPAVFTGLVEGVAVGGYDPVAYFAAGRAEKGSDQITLEHEGATWRFSGEGNRDAFKADPARYAPQYGGYCAFAVSQGYTAKADPEAWTIHDGKLYLNYDKKVRAQWEKDIPGYVAKSDANWPGVLEK